MSFRMSSLGRMAASKFAAAGAAADGSFSSVITLLHLDGTNGQTSTTDASSYANTWDFTGTTATLSTTQAKFGTTSLKPGTTGARGIYCNPLGVEGNFNTGDFTIEGWAWSGAPETGCLFYLASGVTANRDMYWYNNAVNYGVFSGSVISCAGQPLSTWYHWAVARSGTTLQTFIDGNRIATATYNGVVACDSYAALGYYAPNSNLHYPGYIDEVRITAGVCRYLGATYTVPTAAFPNS